MKGRRALAAVAIATCWLVATALPAHAANVRAFTIMNGANEVPGPGDPDGAGVTIVDIRATKGKICVQLAFTGIAAPTLFHIHQAPAGVAGPIVVDFTSLIATRGGCVAADPALLGSIVSDPAGFYCNVHNAAFPAGAIRGQLQPSS